MGSDELGKFGDTPEITDAEVEQALSRISQRGDKHIAKRRTVIATGLASFATLAIVIGILQRNGETATPVAQSTLTTLPAQSTTTSVAQSTSTVVTYKRIDCGRIAIEEGVSNDWSASEVSTMGIDCSNAAVTIRNYAKGKLNALQGFTCKAGTAQETDGEISHFPVTCKNGNKYIYFLVN